MHKNFTLSSEYREKLTVPKTSASHPINISWIIPPEIQDYLSNNPMPDGYDLYDCMSSSTNIKVKFMTSEDELQIRGNMCLSSCPGKKVRLAGPVKGRATINRDLDMDFTRMKLFNISMTICCLNDHEMKYLGAPWPKYAIAAAEKNIKTYRVPMAEGGCPDTMNEMKTAIDFINMDIKKGNNVLVHCRGGVGRAGLVACCWLLENLLCHTAERAIAIVREQRSPKAIETLRQADYIIQYSKFVKQRYGLGFSESLLTKTSSAEMDQHEQTTPSIRTIAKLEYDIMTA